MVVDMKKSIIVIVAVLFLGGYVGIFAQDIPSCLDPQSKDYQKPLIGGMCGKCGKTFTFSGYQLNINKIGNCPYCKYEQSLKDACNRYGEANMPGKNKSK